MHLTNVIGFQGCVVVLPVVDDQKNGMILGTVENEYYSALCGFIREQFERRFSSHLEEFYPLILSYWLDNEIQAVVGFRSAASETLFLERYLAAPIEELLGSGRELIVEIGGFAALNRAAALPLMVESATQLKQLGFRTAVCTANSPIRACLKKLGIRFSELWPASQESAGESSDTWGSYYKSGPVVVAGDIEAGVAVMGSLFGASNG